VRLSRLETRFECMVGNSSRSFITHAESIAGVALSWLSMPRGVLLDSFCGSRLADAAVGRSCPS
jgi:hypothetical protein